MPSTDSRKIISSTSRSGNFLFLFVLIAWHYPKAESWQPVLPLARFLVKSRSPQSSNARDNFFLKRGGLFGPSSSPWKPSSLFDKNHNYKIDHDMGKRARLKHHMSNMLSTVGLKQKNGKETPVLEAPTSPEAWEELETENRLLRGTIRQLEIENDRLSSQQRVVLESFEGEGWYRQNRDTLRDSESEGIMVGGDEIIDWGITLTEAEMANDFRSIEDEEAAMWCDELEDDACPVEPTTSFGEALRDRAYWLVGLLVMQSCSGIILSRNEALLANHPVIIYFLTMLVGAGGNAGNQASVRVIRGIALGTLNEKTQGQFLSREVKMAVALSSILSIAGFLRAAAFRTPLPETVAVTASLMLIVFSSICLGAVLPLLLQKLGVDPAHSSTTIQVVMDILGVFLAVAISSLILDSPFGVLLISRLGG